MSEHIESVNNLSQLFRDHAKTHDDINKRDYNIRIAERLDAVADELVRLYGLTKALPSDLGNIFDLPLELLEELSIMKSDELEDQIVSVINAYAGTASLDQILVGLYRKFSVSQKRRFLQNKLYRMTMVWSVPGKKGIYTTEEPELETDAEPVSTHGGETTIQAYDIDEEIPF